MSSSNAGGQSSSYSPIPPSFSQPQAGYNPQLGFGGFAPQFDPMMFNLLQEQQRLASQEWFERQQAQQQFTRVQQPRRQADDDEDEDDDDHTQGAGTSVASAELEPEEIEEERVPVKRYTKKGKEIADKRGWQPNETMLLAKAWVHASEDSVIGISQTETMFWRKIVDWFNSNTDEGARNKSQLQGKFNKIKKAVKEFGPIFKKLSEQGRQSGADDKYVYDAAHRQYKELYGSKFTYENCWDILKDIPKFWDDHGVSKRSFAPVIDLDDDGPSFRPSPDEGMDHLFRDDPIRRPLGRNVSRKMSSGSDATSGRGSSGSETALLKLEEMLKLQVEAVRKMDEERAQIKEERERRQQHRFQLEVNDAFRLLQQPIPKDLPEAELEVIRGIRAGYIEKYGKYFPNV